MQMRSGKYLETAQFIDYIPFNLSVGFRYQNCIDLWYRALEIRVEKDSVRELH